ncbi:MAG: MarR family transcriptional regulator [Atopobiaceae bacterium]|nr:MarR family transcriptional regulator [Atopobiaceae bacterium]
MTDTPVANLPLPRHVLHDLGFFGHFLHLHAGGRSGQQHILVKLHKSGGHMTQRDLQEAAGISSASISEVLSKLECAGLITRTRSDEDRRQLDIALTQGGTTRAEELIERRREFERQCLTCLSEQEQEQLVTLLDRLAEHWRGLEGEGVCA